jgi:dUTP pyrophosphatase
MTTLEVKRLHAEATIPAYATEGAAGLDLAAAIDSPIEMRPGAVCKVPTGVAVALPPGHEGQIRPRSGLAARHGITVLNAPGTIDEDFRGEIQVLLVHHGAEVHVIQPGDRVAQLVVAPIARVAVSVVDSLASTERGERGFGSTGLGKR